MARSKGRGRAAIGQGRRHRRDEQRWMDGLIFGGRQLSCASATFLLGTLVCHVPA